MTTVAVTKGMIAADSFITHETGKGDFNFREECAKLRSQTLGVEKEVSVRISMASRGDSDIGDSLDDLIFEQIEEILMSDKALNATTLNAKDFLRARKEAIGDGEYEALIQIEDGDGKSFVIWVSTTGRTRATKPPYAIGSDAGFAFAAMDAGANAIQAVAIASKRGGYTGPPIDAIVAGRAEPIRLSTIEDGMAWRGE